MLVSFDLGMSAKIFGFVGSLDYIGQRLKRLAKVVPILEFLEIEWYNSNESREFKKLGTFVI